MLPMSSALAGQFRRTARQEINRRLAQQYPFLTDLSQPGLIVGSLEQQQCLLKVLELAEDIKLESVVKGEHAKLFADVVTGAGGAIVLARMAQALLRGLFGREGAAIAPADVEALMLM